MVVPNRPNDFGQEAVISRLRWDTGSEG
jgi:hypothetical protein